MGKPATVVKARTGHRLATVVALSILLVSGMGYHWLTQSYARAAQSVPIPVGTLARLPMSLADWTGRDVPLDEAIVRATDTDDHVSRAYTHAGTGRGVSLWVAYGVRFRDLMPHRPEVCYPCNGWTLDETSNLVLKTNSGLPLPCRVLRFSRGAMRNERVTVLDYYLLDGRYSANVEALRDRAWHLKIDMQYVAQVQVVCGDGLFQGGSVTAVTDFAGVSADAIRDLLAEAVAKATGRNLAAAN